MTETLEMFVRRSGGRGRIEASARNDARGRRDLDRAARAALARPDVIAVECVASVRTAAYSAR